jgi:hypothetical protein
MNGSSEILSDNRLTYDVGVGIGVEEGVILLDYVSLADDGSFPCRINCSRIWGGMFGGKDRLDTKFVPGVGRVLEVNAG